MTRHNNALRQHMLRKTVVTVVGQSWTAVAPDHVIDAYNRPFNFDPNKYLSKPTSHHDLPPATIMAVYNDDIMSGPKIDRVPTLDTLIEDALTARVMSRPVSLFSMSETDDYADTGLLTMKEIEKLRNMSDAEKQDMLRFKMVKFQKELTKDIDAVLENADPKDIGMPFGSHPEPGRTNYEWIDALSVERKCEMTRYTTWIVQHLSGLTDGAKNHIGHEFGLSLQEVEEFTNWLYSRKVDESREHQYSYYTRQSTSGAQGESDDEPDEPEIPDNPALGPDRGAAYGSAIEPYQHVQDVSMGDSNPTTSHMESKKGGRPDKVDKDGASRPSLGTSSSSDRRI